MPDSEFHNLLFHNASKESTSGFAVEVMEFVDFTTLASLAARELTLFSVVFVPGKTGSTYCSAPVGEDNYTRYDENKIL
jgi:hypothetical protein